ncbi:MAG: hypothetical protein A2091_12695 [Desulfuromonadales bacterium GWD2_61_12]|nr:MAG: hypothetical protein A2005_11420 [Desulfuromonadales bacterium GWC2_61_20]OGR36541.1 MAG: hypothetical protein A2091_12695 [Desulfuromonadales bacterium GWD2_61_12]
MLGTDANKPVADNRRIIDFFDADYGWWKEVYAPALPRRFFSFEMRKRRELVVELLNKYAATADHPCILECGCGPGGILGAFAAHRCRLTGIDINRRHLTQARNEVGENVTWIQADVESLPFRDQSFDIVCCVGVLSYLREDEPAVAEISRVAKPGGVVIMALPNWLMLGKICDPYYYLVWMPLRAVRRLTCAIVAVPQRTQKFSAEMIRRYRPATIDMVYRRHGLTEVESCNVSFGPLTLWRREFLPLPFSMRFSDALFAMGKKKVFSFLRSITNHWIACLVKTGNEKRRLS